MSDYPSCAKDARESGWFMVCPVPVKPGTSACLSLIKVQFEDVWEDCPYTKYGKSLPPPQKALWVRGFIPSEKNIEILLAIYHADNKRLVGFVKDVLSLHVPDYKSKSPMSKVQARRILDQKFKSRANSYHHTRPVKNPDRRQLRVLPVPIHEVLS